MKRYKITVAYDGTDYCGWQVQPNVSSVAETLQTTFKRVFGHEVVVLGASRTDAGVHALGQVALVRSPLVVDPERLRKAWNASLPSSIHITELLSVDERFHPFYNIAYKKYRYYWVPERPLPFSASRVWHFFHTVDHKKLNDVLQVFVGTHDFSAFCTDKEEEKNTVCTINAITTFWDEHLSAFVIEVTGNRFLRHMVRRIVGAALGVASNAALDGIYLRNVLVGKELNHVLPTAPSQGLLLYQIVYISG